MEELDRGVLAVKTTSGILVSWRAYGTEPLTVGYNLYRDGTLLNSSPLTTRTNYLDAAGSTSSKYVVKAVKNGVEGDASAVVTPWDNYYKTIQLQRPSGGTNASGSYTYTPNDMSVGDVDGDGQYELIVKWDPSNSKDNSLKGYTGNVYLDCYEFDGTFRWRIDLGVNIRAGAHYTQFQVWDYDGDGKAEVACRTAPGTIDGQGNAILLSGDTYADYRNSRGYILSGPEYLTMFSGETGAQLSTINYEPARGTVSSWGDSYGNRVDRFLACTAYLDGVHPSLVVTRGYYTRAVLVAYDFSNGKLSRRWIYDGTSSGTAYAQGFHNLSVADVDNDGKDEIIFGSACIDHDGTLYYTTKLGHGDAMHIGQMDPDNTDLEGWFVHEETGSSYGYEMRNLRTGKIIHGAKTGTDNGRGLAADIDPNTVGYEMWSYANYNVYDCKGNIVTGNRPSCNFRIYWDGDLQDEMLDGTTISKWSNGQISTLLNCADINSSSSCNTTKATPCLSADVFGDWREEVIFYNSSNPGQLTIFSTPYTSDFRLYTLMHDPVYREAIAWQNTAYNQPPHLGVFIGSGVSNLSLPDISLIDAPNAKAIPSVSIISPKVSDNILAPTSVQVQASASISEGTISSVSLYVDDVLVSTSMSAPYTFVWPVAKMGTYTLKVVANGSNGTSSTATCTVSVSRLPGAFVYVQATTDDKYWITASNWTANEVPLAFDTTYIRSGEAQGNGLNQTAPMFVESGGTFRLVSGSSTMSNIFLEGGTLKVYTSNPQFTLSGNILVDSASTLMSGSQVATIFGLDAVLSGSADLTKTGVGILQLNADNSDFSGNWIISEGAVQLLTANGLGKTGADVLSGATLQVDAEAATDAIALETGANLILNANLHVQYAVLEGVMVASGKYTQADYPNLITGEDTLIVSILYPCLIKNGAGSQRQTINLGESISSFSYAMVNTANVAVEWSPENPGGIDFEVVGQENKVYISGTPLKAGVYTYTVTTDILNDSVYTKTGVFTVVNPNSSAATVSNDAQLMLYPNPARYEASVAFRSDVAQYGILVLTDIGGRQLLMQNFELNSGNNTLTFSCAGLTSNIYFVQLTTHEGVYRLKLIKE